MIAVSVNLPGARYDVTVDPGLITSTGRRVRDLLSINRAAVITDSNVAPLYLHVLIESLADARIDAIPVNVPAGEEHKRLTTVDSICDSLLDAGADRATPVICLGGGAVTDMGGFVAATLLRGVPLVHLPTSLLAMVDASIGGKTGVNHARGKNLIGAFYQPRAVLIDPNLLKSLPADELRNGLAECIKHVLISDADRFIQLERSIDRALALDVPFLTELVGHNVAIKARVVQTDLFEKDQRAHLNFGHTFGHAFEWATRYAIPHGQAVALGMVAAAFTSVKMKLLPEASFDRIVKLISRAGLPTRGLQAPLDMILEAMRKDKKIVAGRARFILLDRIGHSIISDDVPESLVRDAVESLRG
jgi:3-dehydroquinate synthase